MAKAQNAKGTRDFSALEIKKRNIIFNAIKSVFVKYGFEPLETPALENIETLTDKYGEEGNQLLFRILKSGNFLSNFSGDFSEEAINQLRQAITDKGLRYDLTIPFARFVAKNHSVIGLPYKRYQIQTVWRADRPAKGRYREFYQCDADVVGSKSLIADAEFVYIIDEVFNKLALPKVITRINNRKILYGIAENHQFIDKFIHFTTAVDKLDKIGIEGVEKELIARDFTPEEIHAVKTYLVFEGSNLEKLNFLTEMFTNTPTGLQGINELNELFSYLKVEELSHSEIALDLTLARGLNYYTGSIYEVVLDGVAMGSVASGGRYNNLTEAFGLPNVPGVGLSFGAERIYDVMEQLNLFPEIAVSDVNLLVCTPSEQLLKETFGLCRQLRQHEIAADFYSDFGKLQKPFKYADRKKIPFVLVVGDSEWESQLFTLKDMQSGTQSELKIEEIIKKFGNEK